MSLSVPILTDGNVTEILGAQSSATTITGAAVKVPVAKGDAAAIIDITLASSGTCSAQLECSANGTTGWANVGSAVTAGGATVIPFQAQDQIGQYFRVVATMDGTHGAAISAVMISWPSGN